MIVLASKSPRRQKLMHQISDDFITYDSNIDESKYVNVLNPLDTCINISYHKALKASEKYPNDIVLSADTIVVLNNKIIHKPKDEKDAFNILKLLSNKTHKVITGYTIIYKETIIKKHVISYVTFCDLSDELIYDYIKSGSPLDKAGAYGIQDNEQYHIVKSYVGSYDNIVGFPVKEIKESLDKIIQAEKE